MSEIRWFDVESWGVEGKGWQDTKAYYDRLPAKAGEWSGNPYGNSVAIQGWWSGFAPMPPPSGSAGVYIR